MFAMTTASGEKVFRRRKPEEGQGAVGLTLRTQFGIYRLFDESRFAIGTAGDVRKPHTKVLLQFGLRSQFGISRNQIAYKYEHGTFHKRLYHVFFFASDLVLWGH